MNATETKSYRDSLIRDLLIHSLASIQEDRGGWASDRLDAIRDLDWDLCESSETHKPWSAGSYFAKLRASGKPETFRPAARRF